jgi:tartrate-resistant acid phosphatase type 5
MTRSGRLAAGGAGFVLVLIFVAVGVRLVLRGPAEVETVVPIPPATSGDLTLLFFGDSGTGSQVQVQVAAAMIEVCARLSCDAGLVLGDAVYFDGPLPDDHAPWLDEVMGTPYAALGARPGFRLYAVSGNHDVRAGLQAIRAWAERNPIWSLPDLSFPVPGLPEWIHVFGIFTPPLFKLDDDDDARADPLRDSQAPLAAAETFLCAPGREGWKVLFGHHPLFSSTHGRSKRLAKRLLPLIDRCGVDLYLSGHAHQQEHIHTAEVEQLIQGAAGAVRPAGGWFEWGPRSSFLSEQPGFGVLRAAASALHVNYFDAQGTAIYSWQTER